MALVHDGPAPYAPPASVLEVIDRYRDRGLPTPISTEVLARVGISQSLTSRVLQSLKLLDLVDDDGNPTDALEAYRRAASEVLSAALDQIVRAAYAPVFVYADPSTDPPARVRDAFRGFQPQGQQDRMLTLFYGLCEAAGIIDEAPKRASAPTRPRGAAKARSTPARSRKDTPTSPSTALGDGDLAEQYNLEPAVQGLVRQLALIGPKWTRDRRDQFMKVWEITVDFAYPVHEAQPAHGRGDSE
jgi:hypothetical protein